MKRASVRKRDGRTVAAEVPFREEFELFVVSVAGYGAGGADAAGEGAGEAEVDGLADVALGVGAVSKLVGEGEGGFLDEGGLGFEVGCERVGHGGFLSRGNRIL